MQGEFTFGAYKYGFADALVQSDPETPPEASKILRIIDVDGVVVLIPFVGREQWEEFQRQVALEVAPSSIQIVPGGMIPSGNGFKH